MGRRALRKVDPKIDLSAHYRVLTDLQPPLDPQSLFANAAPLEIEMGSGKGLFLDNASGAYPERNFLGVEVARKYSQFAAARLAKHGRTNACMIDGDGLRLFREFLPDRCAAAVHVYFPDPWWKKRHRKRRVLNASFLFDVVRVLQEEGRLHFWTDVEEYFLSTLELIAKFPLLIGPLPVPETPAAHDLDFRTHFERRTRKAGEPVYRAEFQRAPGAAPTVRPVVEEEPEPDSPTDDEGDGEVEADSPEANVNDAD